MASDSPILEVRGLTVAFATDRGPLVAADHVDFDLFAGRTLCVVGESGCGKTVTALALLRLIPPPGRIVSGTVALKGTDLLKLPERELRALRGSEISIVFQEPMTALNPVYTVGSQVAEVIRTHDRLGRGAARDKAVEVLTMVGMPAAGERYNAYPHELSGGMLQRVMIAVALACHPSVLIADEPTTALDVTIQAQILDLLARLQRDLGMAVLLITHDLGVVAGTAEDVAVMYAGQVVETAPSPDLFSNPLHPYTKALLRSVPSAAARGRPLVAIPGTVPDLAELGPGCRFADRCGSVMERCRREEQPLRVCGPSRTARCVLVEQ